MRARKPSSSRLLARALMGVLLLGLAAIPRSSLGAAQQEEPQPPQTLSALPRPTAAFSAPVPVPASAWATLRSGTTVAVRVRQVFPSDGLSPGERLLNGRPPIQPGDRFLAEVINPPSNPLPLVGGTVLKVIPPGRYGRPGSLVLQMSQLVETVDGTPQLVPWTFDTEDRRFETKKRRLLVTALFAAEGAMLGAAVASQVANQRSPIYVTSGAAIGAIVGVGYASFQRGVEANLEQGDSFEVVVGTTSYRPIPRTVITKLYPAANPSRKKSKPTEQP
jgi:hypothetical protein